MQETSYMVSVMEEPTGGNLNSSVDFPAYYLPGVFDRWGPRGRGDEQVPEVSRFTVLEGSGILVRKGRKHLAFLLGNSIIFPLIIRGEDFEFPG
jgi:hypothetical protein